MNIMKFAWQAFLRDWRVGELRLLWLALVIAVAAVSSVGFLSDRVNRALERDAGQLLAADLLLSADRPIGPEWQAQAESLGLQTAHTWQFRSMLALGDKTALSEVKAVSDGYPLRGHLKIRQGSQAQTQTVNHGPAPGTVWLEPQLMHDLGVQVGEQIHLGQKQFVVEQWLEYEPDRSMQFMNLAPRTLFNAADLAGTQLLGPGSRASYALLMAGDGDAVNQMRTWADAHAEKGQRVRGTDSVSPEVRRSLDRSSQFLSLVALLTVMIASVAIALGVWRFIQRHQDGVAVMRSLGATSGQLRGTLFLEFCLIALLGASIGVFAGFVFHYILLYFLQPLLDVDLPAPSYLPAVQSILVGWCLLLGFAYPALAQLAKVSPLSVLRRDMVMFSVNKIAHYAFGLVVLLLLLWWYAKNVVLALIVGLGFVLAAGVFALCAYGLVQLVAYARVHWVQQALWRFSLAGIVNRRKMTVLQVTSLSIGLMIMLLLTVTRTDLLDGWRNTIPEQAPNRFMINIQAEQLPALGKFFADKGLAKPDFEPMIRGRLVMINQQAVNADDFEDERTKNLITREFNLSYSDTLPENNQLVQGTWLNPKQAEVSFEKGIAADFGVGVGDELSFDIAGQVVNVKISSIREVKWDSMQVNFFAIMSPDTLRDQPATWITSFYLPPGQGELIAEIVDRWPNITVIDVSAVLSQLESILQQVSLSVQSLFSFTLLAQIMVLIAAFVSTYDERIREAAIMRALGATARQLDWAQHLELFLIGLLSGVLAAIGTSLIAGLVATQVLDLPLHVNIWLWLLSITSGIVIAMIGGHLALRRVKLTPPLQVLRNAQE